MQIGEVIAGKYRIERKLGSGGFGDVWVATQLGLNREVALKTLNSFQDSLYQRFEREAQTLVRLDHPSCVQLFDYGTDAGRQYIVMPIVDGVSLDQWIRGNPAVEQRLRVIRQICSAIVAAHACGIVHRDLKPNNVLVTPTPDGPHAVVLDFGIAKLVNAPELDITKTGEVIGTPGYMSPEQLLANGETGPASDLYSLGAIMFEVFEEHPPFHGENMIQLAMQHLTQIAPPASDRTPAHLHPLIAALLAKAPEHRPPSANHVLQALNPRRPTPGNIEAPPQKEVRRTNYLWLAPLALFAIAIAGVAWSKKAPTEPPRRVSTQLREPTALLNTADEPQPGAAPDVGSPEPDAGRGLCPKPVPAHTDFDFWFRLPANYGEATLHPVLIILHDYGQQPGDVLGSRALGSLADDRGMLVIAPGDDPWHEVWTDREDEDRVEAAIDDTISEFCADPGRVFMLGVGNGGDVVYELGVRRAGITALATGGFRMDAHAKTHKGPYRPPYLFTNPTGDRSTPKSGGQPCPPGDDKMSLSRHEKTLTKQWKCSGERQKPRQGCTTLKCPTPLTICRQQGGRLWPEFTPEHTMSLANSFCGMRSATFDYLGQVFDFFDRHDPGPSETEDTPHDVERVAHPTTP